MKLTSAKACVEPGWWSLIDRTLKKISVMGWDGEIFDVKEKFGQLDITIGHASEEIHAVLSDAWKESATICEMCGKPGHLGRRKSGWIKTFCDECWEKENDTKRDF
jgi:hypothetical protein